MFQGWGWDTSSESFAARADAQIAALERCWDGKFAAAAASDAAGAANVADGAMSPLPTKLALHDRSELARRVPAVWVRETLLGCFDYGHVTTRYIRNSLVEVGVHAAHSLFTPSQFMFLFMEDVAAMSGARLVSKLASFTGLTPPRRPVGPKCEASAACASVVVRMRSQRCMRRSLGPRAAARTPAQSSLSPMATSSSTTPASSKPMSMQFRHLDNRTVARLRRFFAPTLEALANDLVPGSHECDEPLRRLRMMRRSYADAGRTCAECPSCEYCQR